MENFTFQCTTKIIFGKDKELDVAKEIIACGAKKVLVHYGQGSVVKSGLLSKVENALKEAKIDYILLGGVVPNPQLGLVRKGIELCKKENIDFLLAVGGGSVIDSCKAIGLGVYYEGDVWEIYEKTTKFPVEKCLPVGTIITIAATGSEMSNSTVITDENTKLKRGFRSDLCRPKFSILNPELTFSLPKYQVACGIADIMSHSLERYFSKRANNEMSDLLAEAVIKNTIKNGLRAMKNPNDYHARSEIFWTSSLSHNDLTGLGQAGDWSTHQIEHELGGLFDVAHGAGLCAVWGYWARYVMEEDVLRFVQYANKIFSIDINYNDLKQTALEGIEATESYFRSIEMPTNISSLLGRKITDEEIEDMAHKCVHFGKRKIGGFKVLDKDDIIKIFKMANV